MRARILTLTILVSVFAPGCSELAYQGLPAAAIPEPTPIADATAQEAALGVLALQVIAAGGPTQITPAQATALLIVLEASAEDREALRILRNAASLD